MEFLVEVDSTATKIVCKLLIISSTMVEVDSTSTVFSTQCLSFTFGVFFVFFLSIVKRTSALRTDIERLKNSLPRQK